MTQGTLATEPGLARRVTHSAETGQIPSGDSSRAGRAVFLGLAAALIVALGIRIYGLSAIGLAEDEVNKFNAVQAYRHGSFVENVEHPMLMKLAIWASMGLADAWNAHVAGRTGLPAVEVEMAVRLPNAVFGSLTVLVLFLLAGLYFRRRVALLAAWLQAVAVPAVWVNRIAKEDTLLAFFFLLGLYFHGRMKRTPDRDARQKKWLYYASAMAFGAMLASKYMPHYLGLTLLLFHIYRRTNAVECPPDSYGRGHALRYFTVLIVVFLALNPVLLVPATWSELAGYVSHQTVTHHGYFMMERLYPNSLDATPLGGTPIWFYLLSVAVKTPPAMLAGMVLGFVVFVRRWREPGPFVALFMITLWLIPHSLSGAKFLRYTASLVPFLCMAAAAGTDSAASWAGGFFGRIRARAGRIASGVVCATVVVLTAGAIVQSAPYCATYVNTVGGGAAATGYYFPHDELYDLFLREAVRDAAADAGGRPAIFVADAPAAVRFYLRQAGRNDIMVQALSSPSPPAFDECRVYIFLQHGRQYMENRDLFDRLWSGGAHCAEQRLTGQPVLRTFCMDGREYRSLISASDRAMSEAAARGLKQQRPAEAGLLTGSGRI